MIANRFWNKLAKLFTKEAPAAAANASPVPEGPRDFETDLEHVYRALLKPGDVAIDVGAHVGRHTLCIAQQVGRRGKVYAFEPLPDCREALLDMLAHPVHAHFQPRVELSGSALGAAPGEAEFVVAVDALAYSGLRERRYDSPTRLERIPVHIETLDSLFAALPACRFIKVDTEGGEYDTFRGGEQLLRRLRPVAAFEFGLASCLSYKVEPIQMGRFWESLNYQLFDITGQPLTVSEFVASVTEQRVWDYFAAPAEQARTIRTIRRACRP